MKHAKSGIVEGMTKRFVVLAFFSLLLFTAGACSNTGQGDIEGATVNEIVQRVLRILAVDGDTLKPAPNVFVSVEEQPGEQTTNRALVRQVLRTSEDGVALFRIPEGSYLIRSVSPEWPGVMTVRLEQDAELFLNLKNLNPQESDGNV